MKLKKNMNYPKKINIRTEGDTYPILIGKNILKNFNKNYLQFCSKSKKILFITNTKIPNRYFYSIKKTLPKKSECFIINIPSGEKNKNLLEVNKILNFLTTHNFDRNDTVAALGGGVVGDTAGFAASIFKRGINFIQVPTTLLSQVDSSVGGKTGVNNSYGKNLIGTFYHPKFVLIDIAVLDSLPKREMVSGFAEILKYSLIMNKKFFLWLCKEGTNIINRKNTLSILKAIEISCKSKSIIVGKDEKEKGLRAILNFGHTLGHALESHLKYSNKLNHGEAVINRKNTLSILKAIEISCKSKSIIVGKDEKEKGLRAILNFGHTLGHALESHLKYSNKLNHGEAVIIGMMAASIVSHKKNFLKNQELKAIKDLYQKLGLNDSFKRYIRNNQLNNFFKIMKKDKKNNSKNINLILLKKIGKAFIYKTTLEKTLIPFVKSELKNA